MRAERVWNILLPIALLVGEGIANQCVPYRVEGEIIACICNATYCDELPSDIPDTPKEDSALWYTTSKQKLGMDVSEVNFSNTCDVSLFNETVKVDSTKEYQKIFGFGGAFTDSFGIDLKKLSPATQDQLMRAYFDPKRGSRYTLGRIPIAGSDFSTRNYSYDDVANDYGLEHFSLVKDDYDYKIPYLKKAVELNPETKFLSAAWTAPAWMKTTNPDGIQFLRNDLYQVYANYLMKFLDEYKRNGLNMWAITTGNEPLTAYIFKSASSTMGWTAESIADWVANYFGPTLSSSPHKDTLILALDDNRPLLPWFVEPMYKNQNSAKYVSGTAVHWYNDSWTPAEVLDKTHEEFPDKFIIMTEASILSPVWGTPEIKSESWPRGEKYILNIIEYMNHWSVGWVDWNLALDKTGGPNYENVLLDSAIIVNPETDEFYKQPAYYAIQHFSKFVDRGSVRISITDTDSIKSTGFLTPSGEVVVVLYNKDVVSKQVLLEDSQKGTLCLELSPQSLNTFKYVYPGK